MPLVTVYMPTHNRAAMAERAITSVLAQTHSPVELIVVDDGSSDDTPALFERLRGRDNIRLLRNEQPRGACAARNRAIEVATGEFITGLDDDDEFAPEHIATLLAHYRDDHAFVAPSLREDTGKRVIIRNRHAGAIGLDSLLHYNKVGNQVLTRTERLRAVGGFDENLPAFQDYDLWVRLVARYGPGLKLPQAAYTLHTAHEQRITGSSAKVLKALDLFTEKHSPLMGPGHRQSQATTRKRLAGEPFTLADLLRLTNRHNLHATLSLYLNRNWGPLKRTLDALRR